MKKYIIDASVILTFLLNENSNVKKEFPQILKQVKNKKTKFYSTSLLPLEIGNGLRFLLKDQDLAKGNQRRTACS